MRYLVVGLALASILVFAGGVHAGPDAVPPGQAADAGDDGAGPPGAVASFVPLVVVAGIGLSLHRRAVRWRVG